MKGFKPHLKGSSPNPRSMEVVHLSPLVPCLTGDYTELLQRKDSAAWQLAGCVPARHAGGLRATRQLQR